MKFRSRKFYSEGIRIVICLLLLASNSGGMVLCVGADGQAKLKPALHHKHQHDTPGCSNCFNHVHRRHGHGHTGADREGDVRLKILADNIDQYCADMPFYFVHTAVKPVSQLLDSIAVGIIEMAYETPSGLIVTEEGILYHFSDFSESPLGMLRTVILLT